MNTKEKKINLLNLQTLGTILFIVSFFENIYALYYEKKDIKLNTNYYDEKDIGKLTYYTQFLVLGITILYVYIAYEYKKMAQVKRKDDFLFDLKLINSIILFSTALIALYIANKNLETDTVNVFPQI